MAQAETASKKRAKKTAGRTPGKTPGKTLGTASRPDSLTDPAAAKKAAKRATKEATKEIAKKKAAKKVAKKAAKKVAKKVAKKTAKRQPDAGLEAAASSRPGRRIVARRSPIHGRGVFALVDMAKGERIVQYKARKITWAQADRWYADDESRPSHTFLFTLDDKYVLDGNKDGNIARWINHSCKPNCESDVVDGQIWISSLRRIRAGEELNYDYNITLETPHTPAEKKRWFCACGAKKCRGTLLGKKR